MVNPSTMTKGDDGCWQLSHWLYSKFEKLKTALPMLISSGKRKAMP